MTLRRQKGDNETAVSSVRPSSERYGNHGRPKPLWLKAAQQENFQSF